MQHVQKLVILFFFYVSLCLVILLTGCVWNACNKISWKVISWQRIALKHCGSLDHILMILLRLRLWPYLALRLTKSWSQWWVSGSGQKSWPARQWWKEVPDGPKGQQEEKQERQVGCRLVFQNYSFDFRETVPEKNAVQNSSMEWWKMQTFTERKVEKQENIECIEMYRNVSDKKKGVIHV